MVEYKKKKIQLQSGGTLYYYYKINNDGKKERVTKEQYIKKSKKGGYSNNTSQNFNNKVDNRAKNFWLNSLKSSIVNWTNSGSRDNKISDTFHIPFWEGTITKKAPSIFSKDTQKKLTLFFSPLAEDFKVYDKPFIVAGYLTKPGNNRNNNSPLEWEEVVIENGGRDGLNVRYTGEKGSEKRLLTLGNPEKNEKLWYFIQSLKPIFKEEFDKHFS